MTGWLIIELLPDTYYTKSVFLTHTYLWSLQIIFCHVMVDFKPCQDYEIQIVWHILKCLGFCFFLLFCTYLKTTPVKTTVNLELLCLIYYKIAYIKVSCFYMILCMQLWAAFQARYKQIQWIMGDVP